MNWLKVAALRLVDALDSDPFDDFTRPAIPKYPETLAHKATQFEADLAVFLLRDGTIANYRIAQDPRLPLDLGDQALHHGLATAAMALKWAVEGPNAYLGAFMRGMADQQPQGILVRGVGLAGEVLSDASNDQASGHLAGLYWAWKHGNEEIRNLAAQLIGNWAYGILMHGHALVNPNGKPTTYGQLINGPLTDPTRASLCLAIYLAAAHMTGNISFLSAYKALFEKYGELAEFSYVRCNSWLGKDYDFHRGAIHLCILNELDTQPAYATGLARLARMNRKIGNAWVAFLCQPCEVSNALKVLMEFTLEDKQYDSAKTNSFTYQNPVLWNGQWCSRQPLPVWQKSGVDFWWQRSPWELDGGFIQPSSRYPGIDFLLAYWALRSKNLIPSEL